MRSYVFNTAYTESNLRILLYLNRSLSSNRDKLLLFNRLNPRTCLYANMHHIRVQTRYKLNTSYTHNDLAFLVSKILWFMIVIRFHQVVLFF